MGYCGILSFLDLVGVAVFAISGMLTAGRKKLDIFGAVVVATVTAIGGGTLRDMLLGEPVFWLQKPIYLWVILVSAAFFPVFLHQKKPPTRAILIADAFGLAVFSITGAAVANQKGLPIILVLVMAIMTGAAGGLLRDILCGEIPLILRREIYATAAMAGGLVYALLDRWKVSFPASAYIGMAVVFLLRGIAISRNFNLPRLTIADSDEK